MVFYQLLHYSDEAWKDLGYFSSLSQIQNAKNILRDKPGFSTNMEGYIVIKQSSPSVTIGKPFFEAIVYHHSEDYSSEHSTTLGFFANENRAQKAIEEYRELNPTEIPETICELIVNKCTLNKLSWADGFNVIVEHIQDYVKKDCIPSWLEIKKDCIPSWLEIRGQ